jgi:hypothetical protein
MQRIAAKLAIGLAVTVIGMLAADSTVGTWKFNPAKSTPTSATTFKSRTDVREATPDGGVKVTRTEQSATGDSSEATYSYKYDGKEYPATGGQFDTIAVKHVIANTLSWEVKKTGGKYHLAFCRVSTQRAPTPLVKNRRLCRATGPERRRGLRRGSILWDRRSRLLRSAGHWRGGVDNSRLR